jgi:nitrogen fixation protein FixH
MMPAAPQKAARVLTGRGVLLCLVGFFVVVFAVNAVMVRVAVSTFGGVETLSSYKAGLQFEREVGRAQRQDALHWHVEGDLKRGRSGDAVLDVIARDAKGAPLTDLTADARLAHPADDRLDRIFDIRPLGGGLFRGLTDAQAGQWELIIDFYRGGERVFRSRSRVTLK